MTCTRCGAAYLPADPECPRCGLPFPGATTPSLLDPGPSWTTKSSERPWVLRGVSVVAVLLLAFLVLEVLRPGEESAGTSLRPANPSASAVPSTGADGLPTGENLAKTATLSADRTGDPGQDAAGRTITYDAENMVDGDLETAWRASGFYSGEYVTITLPARSTIEVVGLTNGYTKVDATSGEDRYPAGRRIKSVTWMFDGGPSHNQDLEDGERGIQFLRIDPVQARTIRLRINQTTTPGQFTDDYTAITELFLGRP